MLLILTCELQTSTFLYNLHQKSYGIIMGRPNILINNTSNQNFGQTDKKILLLRPLHELIMWLVTNNLLTKKVSGAIKSNLWGWTHTSSNHICPVHYELVFIRPIKHEHNSLWSLGAVNWRIANNAKIFISLNWKTWKIFLNLPTKYRPDGTQNLVVKKNTRLWWVATK